MPIRSTPAFPRSDGDLSPTTTGTRVFAIALIFIGILVIFARITAVVSTLSAPLNSHSRKLLNRLFPDDKTGEPRPYLFYFKNLLPSLLLNIALQLFSAVVFVLIEEW